MADEILARSGIYEIVNTANGKRYVGSALNLKQRWHKHRCELRKGRHHSKHLQNAWLKYGGSAFQFRVLELCDREVLLAREQLHIDEGCIYNKCRVAGSPLGVKHSDEARLKMSERRRGVPKSREHVESMRSASIITWKDPRFRQKMRRAIADSYDDELRTLRAKELSERWANPVYRERVVAKMALAHTAEYRRRIGERAKAKWSDPAYRERMSEALSGRCPSAATRAKISASLMGKPLSLETRKKKSLLSDSQALAVLRSRLSGDSYDAIALQFGITPGLVGRICTRRRYQWVAPEIPPLINLHRKF